MTFKEDVILVHDLTDNQTTSSKVRSSTILGKQPVSNVYNIHQYPFFEYQVLPFFIKKKKRIIPMVE